MGGPPWFNKSPFMREKLRVCLNVMFVWGNSDEHRIYQQRVQSLWECAFLARLGEVVGCQAGSKHAGY